MVSVNGGRGRSNNYMVNGGDANDIFVNSPGVQPSPDAIEEFRVITNTFDAEFGRNSGSVVNVVTKSGTNEFHGDVYEFFRNNALNTRGYFDPAVAPYHQNQFGATAGGPIKKDKSFIFGSYEGNRLIQGISSGQVFLPSTGEAAGDFSGYGTPFAGTLTDQPFASQLAARTTGGSGTSCGQAVVAAGGAPIAAGTPYASIFPNNQVPLQCFDPTAISAVQQLRGSVSVGGEPEYRCAQRNAVTIGIRESVHGSVRSKTNKHAAVERLLLFPKRFANRSVFDLPGGRRQRSRISSFDFHPRPAVEHIPHLDIGIDGSERSAFQLLPRRPGEPEPST